LSPLWGLGATYTVHLRLIGKSVVHFLLMLIELFARCYGWGATSEYRLEIGLFARTGPVWPKISGIRGRPHQPFFASYAVYGYGHKFLSFCHNPRVSQTDWGTDDGRTERPSEYRALHYMQSHGNEIKIVVKRNIRKHESKFKIHKKHTKTLSIHIQNTLIETFKHKDSSKKVSCWHSHPVYCANLSSSCGPHFKGAQIY